MDPFLSFSSSSSFFVDFIVLDAPFIIALGVPLVDGAPVSSRPAATRTAHLAPLSTPLLPPPDRAASHFRCFVPPPPPPPPPPKVETTSFWGTNNPLLKETTKSDCDDANDDDDVLAHDVSSNARLLLAYRDDDRKPPPPPPPFLGVGCLGVDIVVLMLSVFYISCVGVVVWIVFLPEDFSPLFFFLDKKSLKP